MSTDPLDTAEGQAEADRKLKDRENDRAINESAARRYGGYCRVCGVLRDYHNQIGTESHAFQPFQPA